MSRRTRYLPVLAVLLLAAWGVAASHGASAQQQIAEFGAWTVYTLSENGVKVCYMYARPTKTEGNYKRRGEPNAMVVRRKSEAGDEVSVTSGYPYLKEKQVQLRIDGTRFIFGLTHKEHAWADDAKENAQVVEAMVRGNRMTVRGTSRKKTFSLDTYSLKGFTAARKAIREACS